MFDLERVALRVLIAPCVHRAVPRYYYRMSAYNAYGEQPLWSTPSYGLATYSLPAALLPAVPTATLFTKNLTLSWTGVAPTALAVF